MSTPTSPRSWSPPHVTEVLRIVADANGEQAIFKGGTSLSKGWSPIGRFSEDVDLFDAMMRALGRDYYVSLLTAAAMHGAAHQAPQVFQVMVDRPLADRDIERVRLRFYANEHTGEMAIEERHVNTGRFRLATRETTLVDLVVHPDAAGGLSNVATVVAEIGVVDVPELARLAAVRSRSVARRLGWLLDQHRDDLELEPLRRVALSGGEHPTRLVRALPARGPIDPSWNLQVNSEVEADL